jgi:hypothetical protein
LEASGVKPVVLEDPQDQPEELRLLAKDIKKKLEQSDKFRQTFKERWDHLYGLYRNYRRLKTQYAEADRDSRGGVLLDSARSWGAELFIPYCFTTVESIVPRVLSNNPKIIVPPQNDDAREAAKRVQELFDVQQSKADYDIALQLVARSGHKYGLGVGKTYWDRVTRVQKKIEQTPDGPVVIDKEVVLFDGPRMEPVDIWNFFWEPSATSMHDCDWVIHRTFRTIQYAMEKIKQGVWNPLTPEALKKVANSKGRGSLYAERMRAAGITGYELESDELIEVWEYHSRGKVVTVIGTEWVVQNDSTPFFHMDLPFQIYRPTIQEHEFVGIGEIEPIAHLQYELNTLRQQRRDNATAILQKSFLYAENWVDPKKFRIGPAQGIPVRGQHIDSVIKPLEFGDIPNSGYNEENALKEDIERTTGISDIAAGSEGSGSTAGTETATGIQLVQEAANVRIREKTKNIEREFIRHDAGQWLELNRQKIQEKITIRLDDPAAPDGTRFEDVGPQELLADFDAPYPEGGSTEPDNPALKQQNAQTIFQALSQLPHIDQVKLSLYLLKEHEVPDAESFIVNEGTVPVDPMAMAEALVASGLDPNLVQQVVQVGLQAGTPAAGADAQLAQEQAQADAGQSYGPPPE